jgi:putative ABC transport system permease protein
MFEYLTIAWRNIWRNRRRTMITLASVFFAVFFAVSMRGFHLGMWTSLLENVLHSYTGYIQVHAAGYWDNKTLEYTFVLNDSLEQTLNKQKYVKGYIPRLESFALASSGEKTKGVLVSGVDPIKEAAFTRLEEKLRAGRLLSDDDPGVVLSQRLAKFLELEVDDTLTLLGQGYQGATAAGNFPVRGIVKLPAPEWDNMMVYLTLPAAQSFYSAPKMLTSLVLDVNKNQNIDKLTRKVRAGLDPDQYEVMNWKEMLIELYQQYEADTASMIFILALLYLIIGFGIFGTVLMMTTERLREFAIMIAVGMKRRKLGGILAAELLYITLLGVVLGMLGSIPLVYYYHINPIEFSQQYAKIMEIYGMEPVMSMHWHWRYIFNQGLAVVAITLIAIIYPIYSVLRLNLIKALK